MLSNSWLPCQLVEMITEKGYTFQDDDENEQKNKNKIEIQRHFSDKILKWHVQFTEPF